MRIMGPVFDGGFFVLAPPPFVVCHDYLAYFTGRRKETMID